MRAKMAALLLLLLLPACAETRGWLGLGPAAPREFVETIASGEDLAPLAAATRGGVTRLEDGFPDIRAVDEGRPATGRGWIGITPREAYLTTDITVATLLPAWALSLRV